MKVPRNWKEVTVGDCCSIRHGYAFEGGAMSTQKKTGPIVVSIGNFSYTGGFRFRTTSIKRVTIEPPSEYILRHGDVLLAMTCQTPGGEILGIPGIIPLDGEIYLHNQRLGLVRLKQEFATDRQFLFYLFSSPRFNKHLVERATGTKVKHTSPSSIESFSFALPALTEQQKIAEILTKWDEALEKLDALIEAKEHRKKALMRQLFSGKIRIPEFNSKWQRRAFGDVLEPITRPTAKPQGNFLAAGVRSHGKGVFLKPDFVPANIALEELFELKTGDLVVNITFAWEGAAAIVPQEADGALVSHRFPTFRFREGLAEPSFFRHYIRTKRFVFDCGLASPGGAGRNRVLSKSAFLEIELGLPPIEEQRRIGTILDTAAEELTLLRKERDMVDQQKRGLMQRLLTGKIRVQP